jgi:YVTN family beta-propeller protein
MKDIYLQENHMSTAITPFVFSLWQLYQIVFGCITGLVCAALMMNAADAAESRSLFATPVYVTLQTDGMVENLQTGTIWSLPGAHYHAVSSDDRHLLVSEAGSSNVYLLDITSDKLLATFDVGPIAQGVAISPDNQQGLAVGAGAGTVTVIELATQKVSQVIPVGKAPHNVCFTPDGKQAYVTLQGSGSIAVLDMQTLEKTDEFLLPGIDQPHNLDLSDDGKTLWIRDFTGQVAAVDLLTRNILAVIPVGQGHAGIDAVTASQYVVTGATADSMVDVIDAITFEVVKRIEVGQGSHGVRASLDGRLVYVGVTSTSQIAAIDTQTLEVVKQWPTQGQFPFWLAVSSHP